MLLSLQIKGWGTSSLTLCARVVAEVRSLCLKSFSGVMLQAPFALCCESGCEHRVGTLQELATATVQSRTDQNPACKQGHPFTHPHSYVGMLPGTDTQAAELLYWLSHLKDNCESDDMSSSRSLATALVRWAAYQFEVAGASPSSCPRVWVAVRARRDNNQSGLILRPVCEHAECMHAVQVDSRCDTGDVASLVTATVEHLGAVGGAGGNQAPTIPLPLLAQRSGLAMAVLTRGDEDMQSVSSMDLEATAKALSVVLPHDARVSVDALSKLNSTLSRPLQRKQVVAYQQRVSGNPGAVDALSHLWLCKHHSENTELVRRLRCEKESVDAVSNLVQWHRGDGHCLHVYDAQCTAMLETAFHNKSAEVKLSATETVQLRSSRMFVKESGAQVGRTLLNTCVQRLHIVPH